MSALQRALPLGFLPEKLVMNLKKVFALGFGSLFGVSALAGFGFWFLAIRAPSARLQCDHLTELMKKENGVEIDASVREACVSKMERTASAPFIRFAHPSLVAPQGLAMFRGPDSQEGEKFGRIWD